MALWLERPSLLFYRSISPANVFYLSADFAKKSYVSAIIKCAATRGFVNVGTDHDTATFAVASIRAWWRSEGCKAYPNAKRILITADAGGSNGSRLRLWKWE